MLHQLAHAPYTAVYSSMPKSQPRIEVDGTGGFTHVLHALADIPVTTCPRSYGALFPTNDFQWFIAPFFSAKGGFKRFSAPIDRNSRLTRPFEVSNIATSISFGSRSQDSKASTPHPHFPPIPTQNVGRETEKSCNSPCNGIECYACFSNGVLSSLDPVRLS